MKAKVFTVEQRIKEVDLKNLYIQAYDSDNAYPQRMLEFINASPTAKQAVALYAKYIRGKGFSNEVFYKAKINRQGLTPDKLLRRLSLDLAAMRGIAVQVNYNSLFQKTELNYTPFENCRLGLEESEMNGKIALHSDWGKRNKKTKLNSDTIDYLDRYNPNPEVIMEQVEQAGGWDKWQGQVFWLSMDFENYPTASCDAVIESLKAEIESDKTTTNNLKNNFALKYIYANKGVFEDETEKDEFMHTLRSFMGSDADPLMLIELEEEDQKPELIEIKNNLNDKLFEYTDKKVERKIIQHYNQPGILHSMTDSSNLFSTQNVIDARNYYNDVTIDERLIMEEIFMELCTGFATELNASNDYKVQELGSNTTVQQ